MMVTLKAARINAGLTQVEVAEKLGLSPTTVCSWENGTNGVKATDFKTLCDLYGCRMDEVILPEKSTISG